MTKYRKLTRENFKKYLQKNRHKILNAGIEGYCCPLEAFTGVKHLDLDRIPEWAYRFIEVIDTSAAGGGGIGWRKATGAVCLKALKKATGPQS